MFPTDGRCCEQFEYDVNGTETRRRNQGRRAPVRQAAYPEPSPRASSAGNGFGAGRPRSAQRARTRASIRSVFVSRARGPGEVPDLAQLDDGHGKTGSAQGHRHLKAACGFQHHHFRPCLLEPLNQRADPRLRVIVAPSSAEERATSSRPLVTPMSAKTGGVLFMGASRTRGK
jgi:hypothetical protein